jgi:hypothetical protein
LFKRSLPFCVLAPAFCRVLPFQLQSFLPLFCSRTLLSPLLFCGHLQSLLLSPLLFCGHLQSLLLSLLLLRDQLQILRLLG